MMTRVVRQALVVLTVIVLIGGIREVVLWWQDSAVVARIAAIDAGAVASPAAVGATPPRDADRRVRFAQATALDGAGRLEDAARLYGTVIQRDALDDLGAAALFNQGNGYLRAGIALAGQGDGSERSAMLELAKQRYRDLLRLRADDWDARYNLERALRLAPEDGIDTPETYTGPSEQRQIRLRGFSNVELP